MDQAEKDKILKKLGQNLKNLKQESGLSYRKLALRCNLDHADIKNYEKGKDIQFLTIIELAKAYGVHPIDIINLEYEMDFPHSKKDK